MRAWSSLRLAPFIVGLERELVVDGFDITSTARVSVRPPGASEFGFQFKHGVCLKVELGLKTNSGTHARESVSCVHISSSYKCKLKTVWLLEGEVELRPLWKCK
jgi:hypothetical protein